MISLPRMETGEGQRMHLVIWKIPLRGAVDVELSGEGKGRYLLVFNASLVCRSRHFQEDILRAISIRVPNYREVWISSVYKNFYGRAN